MTAGDRSALLGSAAKASPGTFMAAECGRTRARVDVERFGPGIAFRASHPNERKRIMNNIIFANAGIAKLAPFSTVDEGFFDLHFDANVEGLFSSVQKGLP